MPAAGRARRTIVTHKQNLLDLTPSAAEARLRAFAADVGTPGYRASQVMRRLWVNPAPSFEAMTELPVAFRGYLDAAFEIPRLDVLARQKSTDGTEKFLFRLRDGQAIEGTG
jgi:23S rRNA (adenine2503-C2)-methyltransferase